MKAGRLSLDTLTHQKAPKKKKPRAASDTWRMRSSLLLPTSMSTPSLVISPETAGILATGLVGFVP